MEHRILKYLEIKKYKIKTFIESLYCINKGPNSN